MRIIGFVLLLLPVLSLSAETPRGEYSGAMESVHPTWFKESFLIFEEDVQEATTAGKRVMIYVYQDGCPYCNAFVEHNLAQRDIETQLREHFDVIALNMWGDREIKSITGQSFTEKTFAKAIGVQYTPTVLFLGESGQIVLRLNGYVPPQQFKIALDYVAGRKEQQLSYQDYYAQAQPPPASGELRSEPYFMPPPFKLDDRDSERPLLVLFEQKECPACERFHDTVLAIVYAPSMVFFDTRRADALLKSFHLLQYFDISQDLLQYFDIVQKRAIRYVGRYPSANADRP